MTGLLLDLRLVWRGSRRQLLPTVAAILTVAVGVSALAAALAIARAALVTPFPYRQPDRLVDLQATREEGGRRFGISPADFLAWRERSVSFERVAGYVPFGSLDLVPPEGDPLRLRVSWVSPGFFETLGVAPVAGRTFLAEEEAAGRDHVALLSHRLFVERFAADPAVVGEDLMLNGEPWRVVGIMPPAIGVRGGSPDLWAPLSFGPHRPPDRSAAYLGAVARLASGRTLAEAQAEMAAVGAQLEKESPETNRELRPSLLPLLELLRSGLRPTLRLLISAAALVLLVGAVNYWSLLLTRARAGARQEWVRRSLGASRWRATRLLLVESLCLALAGACIGSLMAGATLSLLPDLGGRILYRSVELRLDPWSVLAAAGLAAALALAAGGWVVVRASPRRAGGLPGSRWLARGGGAPGEGVTVILQVAVTVVLLLAALSTLRRVGELAARDLGFRPSGVLAFDLAPPPQRYPNSEALNALYRDLLRRLGELPGVEAAGVANSEPGGGWGFAALAEGSDPETAVPARYLLATPGFFAAAGLRLVEGRLLDDRDGPGGEPVLVISAGLARDLFDGGGAVSERVRFEGTWHRVVGVVEDVRRHGGEALGRHCYLPFEQQATLFDPVGERRMVILARGSGDLAARVRAVVRSIDPQLPVSALGPLAARVGEGLFRPRLLRQVLGFFAVVALLLTALGLYGTLAGGVARRRFELGVRLALGADPASLVLLVVQRALLWTAAGLLLAVPLAVGFQGWLQAMVEGVEPWTWTTLVLLFSLVVATALAAAWLPASQVRRISPSEALAGE